MNDEQKEKINELGSKVKSGCKTAFYWTKDRFYDCKRFYTENKEFLLVLAPIFIGGYRMIHTSDRQRFENDKRDLYIWDNRTGQYYRLRRKLRVGEQLELDRRRSEGESVGQILMSMRVL